jgi:hypothetical protein
VPVITVLRSSGEFEPKLSFKSLKKKIKLIPEFFAYFFFFAFEK